MKTRLRAFGLHLLLSVLVLSALLGAIFLVWYPVPYFQANSAWDALQVVIFVDVVVGPLLTLLVYRPGKPGLKFDMVVIVLIQLVAFGYGASILHRERPSYAVFAVDRFAVVTASQVAPGAAAAITQGPWTGPTLAFTRLPTDPQERQDFLWATLVGESPDLHLLPERYRVYGDQNDPEQRREILARSLDVDHFAAASAAHARALEGFLAAHGGPPGDYGFLPLEGPDHDMVMVIARRDLAPVAALDVDPWVVVDAMKRADQGASGAGPKATQGSS
ncbi:MAG: hypothetical protein ACFCBW_14570 [Candidatus Competibacterales bacterium]